jgi:hypothetical protein
VLNDHQINLHEIASKFQRIFIYPGWLHGVRQVRDHPQDLRRRLPLDDVLHRRRQRRTTPRLRSHRPEVLQPDPSGSPRLAEEEPTQGQTASHHLHNQQKRSFGTG